MKFSHTLLFNAVPEWTSYYINYEQLKAAIYRFEKSALLAPPPTDYKDDPGAAGALRPPTDADLEAGGSSGNGDAAPADQDGSGHARGANEKQFLKMLDRELDKVCAFYKDKERKLLSEDLQELMDDVDRVEKSALARGDFGLSDDAGASLASADSDEKASDDGGRAKDRDEGEDADGETAALMGHKKTNHRGDDDDSDDQADERDRRERQRGVLEHAFASRKMYNEATRAGREMASKAERANSNAKASAPAIARKRATSAGSTSELIDTAVPEDAEASISTSTAAAVAGAGPVKPPTAPLRRPSASKGDSFARKRRVSLSGASPQQWGTNSGSLAAPTPRSQSRGRRTNIGSILFDDRDYGDEADEVQGVGVWAANSDWAIDNKIMYKRRITAVFTSLSELKQFVDLNYTGLSKILKKFDKITNSNLRSRYMKDVVDAAYPFQPETRDKLTQGVASLVPLYARIVTHGDDSIALSQLKGHLREHVVWERNTVWREMIGLERRGWGAAGGGGQGGNARAPSSMPMVDPSAEAEAKPFKLRTPLGTLSVPRWIADANFIAGVTAVVLFLVILNAQWFERVEEQNCLALLVLVVVFWALEIIPLFVTALMVPFFVVVLGVLRSTDGDDRRLTASESTKYIFSQMFSPTIMLLLGGFTLAAALSKQNIDKVLATKVLSLAGTRPRTVLLAYMCVACFASMWISNVAAPVLCYSLIQPILRTLPSKAPFSKALILGIALSSNIGGLASPISSPQNLIALEYMNPPVSWLQWFAVSIPVASCAIFCIWILLLWSYRPSRRHVTPGGGGGAGAGAGSDAGSNYSVVASGQPVVINPVRVSRDKWTREQWFVVGVSIATIFGWILESKLEGIVGDMGIIAIFPIVMFYGTGILRKADFDHSPWSIVFLAMGGIALGKAVLSSGLLDDMDRVIQRLVLGLDIWLILAIFSVIVAVVATVISHTISAVLIVPIAERIGSAMDTPHPRLLIFATALLCSSGMGLSISGFPNLQAANVEDDIGQRYLTPKDFFKNGIPATFITTIVIITVGYGIMRLLGL